MVTRENFGVTPDGRPVECLVLRGEGGMEASILTLGGIIREIRVPDRTGVNRNVVLNYRSLREYYEEDTCYLGACIGPHGNRITAASFNWKGITYHLEKNEGGNNLHSGSTGFHHKIWEAEEGEDAVTLHLSVPDGEGGFPGNRKVSVTYRVTGDNALEISYCAETDADTPFNMTNHSYFNLSGRETPIFDHELQILSDEMTEIGEGNLPTGRLLPVAGTPFDFREPKKIGTDARTYDEQLALGQGYDHNFVLRGSGYRKVAQLTLEETGIGMEVFTDQPGVQFYAGNLLTPPHEKNTAVCLETQHFPDSVNHENFPGVILLPGEKYRTKTAYRFFVR